MDYIAFADFSHTINMHYNHQNLGDISFTGYEYWKNKHIADIIFPPLNLKNKDN